MKRFLCLLLVTLMTGLFSACGMYTVPEGKAYIGILMPTKEQTIWTTHGTRLTEAFEAAGYSTVIEYAEDDAARQAMQVENMITRGVDVLIVCPVDCATLTDACEKARDEGILIIAEDRLITNTDAVDYYVTADMYRVGEMQGQHIADTLDLEHEPGPFTIELFCGSQDDTNALVYYDGAMRVLDPYIDAGKLEILSGQREYTVAAIQSWDSARAQARMDNLLSAFYTQRKLDAVLASADCLAMGVISSLESMGYGTQALPFPVITGQDAELASVKYILSGSQSMTVFVNARDMASIAVSLVDDALAGKEIRHDTVFHNGVKDVPTLQYAPTVITADNVDLLTEVGFFTEAQIYG